jgi:hypothetical protein
MGCARSQKEDRAGFRLLAIKIQRTFQAPDHPGRQFAIREEAPAQYHDGIAFGAVCFGGELVDEPSPRIK